MLHGWIILDKPIGLGSTTAVSAVKRILRQAGEPKTKVGHGGTLDPLASGVLPIALGEATKLAGRMLDATKSYDFTIRLGEETDTLDGEGAVVERSDVRPTLDQVEAVLPRFTGEIEQVPPAYSALKIDGKAAYARARAGEQLEMKARTVTINSLTIRRPRESEGPASLEEQRDSRFRGNDGRLEEITLSATVSKGTYIRSLAAILPMRLERSVTSPISGGPAPVRSRSNAPFRWTFWKKPLRRGNSMGRLFRCARRWTTSRPSPSPPTRLNCSVTDRSLPGSPQSRG